MGRMSRNKGKTGEREVAKLLREYGYHGKRGNQFKGGPESPDVAGLPEHHIEVKRVEAFRLYDALAQANSDAGPFDIPVVFHRSNGHPWVVVLEARDYLKMMVRIRDLEKKLDGNPSGPVDAALDALPKDGVDGEEEPGKMPAQTHGGTIEGARHEF